MLMKTFLFPPGCARCGCADAQAKWRLRRKEVVQAYEITQTMEIPLCNACRSTLIKRRGMTALWAVAGGLLVGAILWCSAWLGVVNYFNVWANSIMNGLFFAFFLWFLLYQLEGESFAWLARGGWKIQFADLHYQRVTDQLYGLPEERYLPRLAWRERFNYAVFGLGFLFIDSCFACAMGENITAMAAFLLAIAVLAFGLLYFTLSGKRTTFVRWLSGPTSEAEAQKEADAMNTLTNLTNFLDKQAGVPPFKEPWNPALPAVVGWGIFLGFLAMIALAIALWLALRD